MPCRSPLVQLIACSGIVFNTFLVVVICMHDETASAASPHRIVLLDRSNLQITTQKDRSLSSWLEATGGERRSSRRGLPLMNASEKDNSLQISISAYGGTFLLELLPKNGDFKVQIHPENDDGKEDNNSNNFVPSTSLFRGSATWEPTTIMGKSNSSMLNSSIPFRVHHVERRGGNAIIAYNRVTETFSGKFEVDGVTYYIEEEDDDDAKRMILFESKGDDDEKLTAKIKAKKLLSTPLRTSLVDPVGPSHLVGPKPREERGNVCEMLALVDSSLYSTLKKDNDKIAALINRVIEASNDIYENQVLVYVQKEVKSVKFELKKLIIATDAICSNRKYENSYLCKPNQFKTDSDYFLRMHSKTDYSDYCLAYLFTSLDFDGTLGVAYVGGVCANYARIRDQKSGVVELRSTNTGFVSLTDARFGVEEAEHTLAHEMGHNFGASHDLKSNCGVMRYHGYLMAPTAPTFDSPMSRRFSLCSTDAIEETIDEMKRGTKDWCFAKEKKKQTPASNSGGDINRHGPFVPAKTPTRVKDNNDKGNDDGVTSVETSASSVGLLVGLVVSLSLMFILTALFILYSFVEQRFCFDSYNPAPLKLRVKNDIQGTLSDGKEGISSLVRGARAMSVSGNAQFKRMPAENGSQLPRIQFAVPGVSKIRSKNDITVRKYDDMTTVASGVGQESNKHCNPADLAQQASVRIDSSSFVDHSSSLAPRHKLPAPMPSRSKPLKVKKMSTCPPPAAQPPAMPLARLKPVQEKNAPKAATSVNECLGKSTVITAFNGNKSSSSKPPLPLPRNKPR